MRKIPQLTRNISLCIIHQTKDRLIKILILYDVVLLPDLHLSAVNLDYTDAAADRKLHYILCKEKNCGVRQTFLSVLLRKKPSGSENLPERKPLCADSLLISL